MAKRKPTSTWCIIRNNGTLRELIRRRMDDEGMKMQDLADKSGVPYDQIRQYLKKYDYEKGMSQWNVLEVAKALGIQVGLDIQLKYG